MSAKETKPVLDTFSTTTSEPKKQDQAFESRPVTLVSEHDAYIAERIKEQPRTLAEVESEISVAEKDGIHRLSLPDFFEPMSYDCTRGIGCEYHAWHKTEVMYGLDKKMDRWEQAKRGKFIFRWLNKNKRALDHNLNVRGWKIVSKFYFEEAPKTLFSVSGGVENGDSILAFMSVSKATSMREKPSKDSQDRINSVEKQYEGHQNFYKAKLSPDKEGVDDAPADAYQEGRDF